MHVIHSILVAIILIGSFSSCAQAVEAAHPFEAVLAFAGTNRVRIDCRMAPSQETSQLQLEGTITHATSQSLLWQGTLGAIQRNPDSPASFSATVENLNPQLWEPSSPSLYLLTVTARSETDTVAEATIRFGFRSIEIQDGQFILNGRPIFLRGIAINPPGRTIPDQVGESPEFARDYVAFLKSQNVNIFRISTDVSQVWFDACDEIGMLMYAGRYGAPPESDPSKKGPPEDFEKSLAGYLKLFEQCANHPSIIIYYLANELPVSGSRGAAYSEFLDRAHAELRKWDPTRPFIANAGYGEGREGDICDVHRYWGWYYNSFTTYYNLRDRLMRQPLFGPGKNQPLTFTECVGAFTGSSGEFNLVRSKQLAPRLGWLGNTQTPVQDSLAYQSFIVKEATESFRRMRPFNPRLAGIMPFTIFFYNWAGIDSFAQMRPKPAMDQLRISYQPVLLSWEMWTPQVYAGSQVRAVAHVINDDDLGAALTNAVLLYNLTTKEGRPLISGSIDLPDVAHFGTFRQEILFDLPRYQRTDDYIITGAIQSGTNLVSTNWTHLFIAEPAWGRPPAPASSPIYVYDPSARTAEALRRLGITATRLPEIKPGFDRINGLSPKPRAARKVPTLILGELQWGDHLHAQRAVLKQFVRNGGRILCLQQFPERFSLDWLPVSILPLSGSANHPAYPPASRPHREQSHVNPERPSHPVFLGLDRQRLAFWSDYTRWDQSKPGYPKIHPVTAGFRLQNPADLAWTAILADYDRGLEGVALCEVFDGRGSVILSALDIINRIGLDPAADRLLANLVAYAADPLGHDPLPVVSRPIRWGDLPSEQGVVCGSLNGLLVNAEWVRGETQQNQKPLPPNTGAWNMMPGDQFVPRGRNPFGTYEYTTGASLRTTVNQGPNGEGFFLARVPQGSTSMSTSVSNPASAPAQLTIGVNGVEKQFTIPPGELATLQNPLPAETALHIRYAGPKTLILLETRFK